MDWIRENKSLAAIFGIFGVASLALGYLLYDSWNAYTEKKDNYLATGQQLTQMQNAVLSPTDENVKKKQALVAEFAKEVDELGFALAELQPRVEPIKNIDFQAKLKNQVAEARKAAAQARMNLPPDFAFGFEDYTSNLPSETASTELSGYLDAMNELVNLFMKCGVESVDLLERSKLPVEQGTKASTGQPKNNRPAGRPGQPQVATGPAILEKSQISAILTLDQGPLQLLIMKLAAPSEVMHFTNLRLLRIENQLQDGPLRMAGSSTAAAPAPAIDAAAPAAPGAEAAASNEIKPPPPAAPDSVPLLGLEKLKVRLEIDLVKFLPAAAGALANNVTGAAPMAPQGGVAAPGALPSLPGLPAAPGASSAPAPAELPGVPSTPAPAAPAAQP